MLDRSVSVLLQSHFRQLGIAPGGRRPGFGSAFTPDWEKTMRQNYFILVVAHSLHGRLRRIQVPHQVVYAVLGLALFGGLSVFGFVSSYARMAWKVANYNALKREADSLRARYRNLQRTVNETNVQLASLQTLASEISVATGFKQKMEGPSSIASEGAL